MNIIFKSSEEAIDLLKNFNIENTLFIIEKEYIENLKFNNPVLPIDINLCGVENALFTDFKYFTPSNQENFQMTFREFTILIFFNLIDSTKYKNLIFIVKNFTREFKNAWKYFLRRSKHIEYFIPNCLILYDKLTSDISENDFQYFNAIESTSINELYTYLFSHYTYKGTIDYALVSHFFNINKIDKIETEYIFNDRSDSFFDLDYLDEYFFVYKIDRERENKIRDILMKNEDMDEFNDFEQTYKIFTRNMKILKENYSQYKNLILHNNLLSANVYANRRVFFLNSEKNFRGRNIEKKDIFIDRIAIFHENAYQVFLKLLTGFKQIYELNGIKLKNFMHNVKLNTVISEGEEYKKPNNAEEIYEWYIKDGYQGHSNKKEVEFEVELSAPDLLNGGEVKYIARGISKKIAKDNAAIQFLTYLIKNGILNESYQFTKKIFKLYEQFLREKFEEEIQLKNDDIRTILNQIDEEERCALFEKNISINALIKYFTVRDIYLRAINRPSMIEKNFYAEKIILHKEKSEVFTTEFTSTVYLYCNSKYLKLEECTDDFSEYKVEGPVECNFKIKNHIHLLAMGLSEQVNIETEDIIFLQKISITKKQLEFLRTVSSLIFNFRKNTEIGKNISMAYNYLIVPIILDSSGKLCVEYFYKLFDRLKSEKIMHSSSIFSYKNLHKLDIFYNFAMQKTQPLSKKDIINFERFTNKLYDACNNKEERPVFTVDRLKETNGTSLISKCEMINGSQFYTLSNFLIDFNMKPISEEQLNLLQKTIGSIIFTYKISNFIAAENLIIPEKNKIRKRKSNFFKKSSQSVIQKDSRQLIDLLRISFNNNKLNKGQSYDQLEFIGDCILKFNIATELVKNLFFILSSFKRDNFKFGDYIKEITNLSFSEQIKILHNNTVEKINPLKILISAKSYFISNLIFKDYAHNMKLNEYISNEQDIEQPRISSVSVKNEWNLTVEEDDAFYEYADKINKDLGSTLSDRMNKKINFSVKKIGRVRADMVQGQKVLSDVYEAVVGSYFIYGGLSMVEKNVLQKDFYANRDEYLQKIMLCFFNDKLHEIFNKKFSIDKKINIVKKIGNIHSFDEIFKNGELEAVESIFKYKFKNRAFLETALIHPSYSLEKNYNIEDSVNIFSRNAPFEIFEFIGDAVIDLFIMENLYSRGKYPYGLEKENYVDFENIPCEDLHLYKAKHVCNINLAKVLVKLNLHKYIKNCLTPEEIELCTKMDISDKSSIFNNYTKLFNREDIQEIVRDKGSDGPDNKIKKASLKKFGDMFEALIGAVFIDCNFNYDKIKKAIPEILNAILN